MKVNLRLWNNAIGPIRRAHIAYINAMCPLSVKDAQESYKKSRHEIYAFARSMIKNIKTERQAITSAYDQSVIRKRGEKVNACV